MAKGKITVSRYRLKNRRVMIGEVENGRIYIGFRKLRKDKTIKITEFAISVEAAACLLHGLQDRLEPLVYKTKISFEEKPETPT